MLKKKAVLGLLADVNYWDGPWQPADASWWTGPWLPAGVEWAGLWLPANERQDACPWQSDAGDCYSCP